MPAGRPTKYTPEVAHEICSRLAAGESLLQITKDDHLPCKATIFNWLFDDQHQDFLDNYEKARSMQAESFAEELMDIADDGRNDWMEKYNKDGEFEGYIINGEHIQRSRLRVDARKWIASRLLPKRYGDRVDHLVGGGDKPVELKWTTEVVSPTSKEKDA